MAFLMALMIQARHLFYGLAMLERYKGYGLRSFYMIFAMSDETLSITCSAEPPEGVDRGWFMFFITLLEPKNTRSRAGARAALGGSRVLFIGSQLAACLLYTSRRTFWDYTLLRPLRSSAAGSCRRSHSWGLQRSPE